LLFKIHVWWRYAGGMRMQCLATGRLNVAAAGCWCCCFFLYAIFHQSSPEANHQPDTLCRFFAKQCDERQVRYDKKNRSESASSCKDVRRTLWCHSMSYVIALKTLPCSAVRLGSYMQRIISLQLRHINKKALMYSSEHHCANMHMHTCISVAYAYINYSCMTSKKTSVLRCWKNFFVCVLQTLCYERSTNVYFTLRPNSRLRCSESIDQKHIKRSKW